MNYRMIAYLLGVIILIEAAFLLLPLLVALIYGEASGIWFLAAVAFSAALGFALTRLKPANRSMYAKEGFVITALAWIVISLVGAAPFTLCGQIPSYLDAVFETASGFTTTGASILPDVEALDHCMLFWRSLTHWLGGMGILVFMLAIVNLGGGQSNHLLRAESPGPNVSKLVPRMRKTAGILYIIYIVLTLLNVVFLLVGKMPLFDAICTAFGTAGTGGFGIKNDSIASYSPYIQYVTTVFMFLFGINFSCYYLILLRQFRDVFRDEELRAYVCIVVASIALICLNIRHLYSSLEETFRHASFTVSTIITTTGFATTDFDLWPAFSKGIILFLMVVGACAGSTGGGLKVARLLLLLKSLKRNIGQVLNPRRVQVVRNNGRTVDEKIIDNTNAYLAAYVCIIVFSFILISLDNFSIGTNFSAVLACFNNIGPGLEAVGPTCNYAAYSDFSKLVLSADMLAGRLEIFPILLLFSRSTWKH